MSKVGASCVLKMILTRSVGCLNLLVTLYMSLIFFFLLVF